jgi:hypothetical protein
LVEGTRQFVRLGHGNAPVLLDTFSFVVNEGVEELGDPPVRVRTPELKGRRYLQVGLDQDQGATIFSQYLQIGSALV